MEGKEISAYIVKTICKADGRYQNNLKKAIMRSKRILKV
jgi:hypothetical protein